MDRQVLLDKLSEFLMVEQGGLELYRVAYSRASNPQLKERYKEFLEQTDHHRIVLTRLIERLGADPNYISPGARLAQVKSCSLLEAALRADGLSQAEIEANDLENLLLAETKDHADWHLLELLANQIDDNQTKSALMEAVSEVEAQEDTHLEWARETLSQLALKMILEGPSPPPERWQSVISGPEPHITEIHPAPIRNDQGLLEFSLLRAWDAALPIRDSAAS